MNIAKLNTAYDGGLILNTGSGGDNSGGVTINNQDKSVNITENGTTEVVADSGYTGLGKVTINTSVASSGGGSKWTGHADVEGLKAIGWTDEDIAYYQENGVNWNEEDDEYHKVTDDNKALYGVLTANNISTYNHRIVYLPKIDTSAMTDMSYMFRDCYSLVSIPQLDTGSVTNMSYMFSDCYSLVSIPQLDTSRVTHMFGMMNMFNNCYSLVSIPQLDTSKVTAMSSMFYNCYSLVSIPQLDTQKVGNVSSMFNNCFSLTHINLKNASLDYQLNNSSLLSKESLLYLINNEAATRSRTIKLSSYAYTRLAEDADVVAALVNHPNISLAQ